MKTQGICLLFLIFSKIIFAQNTIQTGMASYYIDKFDGRQTASGEKFDNSDYLGCHKKLPFNTMVQVKNTSNNKTVVVRIVDRGPYAHGRVIDLSKTAAQKIGLVSTGVARVEIKVVGKDGKLFEDEKKEDEEEENNENNTIKNNNEENNQSKGEYNIGKTYSQWGTERNPKGYGVQLGSFSELENAQELCKKMNDTEPETPSFIQVTISGDKKVYKVITGEFDTIQKATILLNQLKEKGVSGILKEHFD